MQEKKLCEGQELICINVDKVYDWIVKEKSFDIFPTGAISFPGILSTTTLVGATVSCEVTPAATNPIVITNRENRPFCIDGKTVLLQQLNIQKNFDLIIFVTLASGLVLKSGIIPISRCEQITLCAPEGTDVAITYTDLDCFVCTPGTSTMDTTALTITFTGLNISVATCQSIQSTFPVTVEFLADFCEPRDEFPTACPAPMRPKQCSVVFPDDHHGHCCH